VKSNDKIKVLDYLKITLIEIIDKKLNLLLYIEDYMFNQDGKLLIIGSISSKQTTYPIIIEGGEIE
jgi:hypothetical protein